jgi:hypothetical protein
MLGGVWRSGLPKRGTRGADYFALGDNYPAIPPAHFEFSLGVANQRIVCVEFRRQNAPARVKRTPEFKACRLRIKRMNFDLSHSEF